MSSAPTAARRNSILALSFGVTLAVFIAGVLAIALNADACTATSYTMTSTAPTTNWSDTTKWSPNTSFPGQCAGDSATISLSGTTINVDVAVANPVALTISNFIPVTIPSGSALTLEASSSATSSNTFTVNGGTLGVSSTANLAAWQGPITINSGTFNVAGSIAMSNGSAINVNGGTIQGGGTVTIPSGHAITFSGSGGTMTITGSGTTIDNFGSLTFSSSSNALSINSGARIKNEASGAFGLSGDAAINTDNVSSPVITNIGTFSKTGGTDSIVNVAVNNTGTVSAGTTTLELLGGGTHAGTFNISGSTAILRFNGTHVFGTGTAIAPGPLGIFEVLGGTFEVNSAFSIPTLKQTAGTVTGTAALTVTSNYDWAGGTQDSPGGGSTQISGGTLTIDPAGSTVTLTGGRVINSSGAISYAPTSTGNLAMLNGSSITESGTFTLSSDNAITSDATSPHIDILGNGILTKSGGTKTIIGPLLNINGSATIQPSGNTISFGGGGSIGGTAVTVNTSALNSFLEFSGGTTTLTGGITYNGANFKLASGATLLNNATSSLNTVTQDGTSVLTLNATMSVNSSYTWNGGTINGTGTIGLGASTTFSFAGSTNTMTLTGGASIKNVGGAMNYAPTTFGLAINSGSSLNNSSGTLTLTGSIAITSDLLSGPQILSGGTIQKTGATTLTVGAPFNSSGSLSVAGTLKLTGGGSITGSTATLSGATDRLELNSTFTATTATWSGSGTLAVSGAVSATSASIPNLELNSGGTLGATGVLTVTNFKWTGGTLNGGGSMNVSSTVDMTGLTAAPAIASFTLTNNGTLTYNPAFSLTFAGSGTVANFGTFNITGNGSTAVTGVSNSFINSGTLKKTSGGGVFTFNVQYTQSAGTTDCADPASTIAFTGGGSLASGSAMTASNATGNIDFTSGSFSLNGGTLSGPGPIELKGATLTLNAATAVPAIFNMTAGSIIGTGAMSVPNASQFNWSGGSIGGSGGMTIVSGGAVNADTTTSSLIYAAPSLIINSGGNFHWNAGANSLIFNSGAAVNDAGTFTVGVNATLGNSAAGSFAVNGQFTFSGNGTLNVTLPLNVQTGGTISSTGGGILALLDTAGVSHAGTFDAQGTSFIDFAAGTHNFNTGAGFSAGTGTVKVAGATLNLNTGVNVTAANFALISGAVSGGGNLTTTSTFTWQGGAMSGAGVTTASSGSASLGPNALQLARNLTLSVPTAFNDAGGLTVGGGVLVTNSSTFDMQSGNVACTVCTGSFQNNGTLKKSTSAGLSTFSVPITGSGALNVTLGTFSDLANSTFNSAAISGGASVIFSAATTIGAGNVTGSGVLQIIAGTTTVSGTTTLTGGGAITVSGGTLTLNNTTNIDTLNLTAGTLNGSGNVTVNTAGAWTGGTLSGTGTATFSGPVGITGATGPETLGRNTTFASSVAYTGPNATNILTINSGVTVTNNGTFAYADQNINGTGATFTVGAAGSLDRISGATGTLSFGPFVNTAGTNLFSVGTTDFPNGYQQGGGSTTMNGGSLSSAFGFTFNGGFFTGFGTITGAVTNNATVNLVNAGGPGALSISGNYMQGSTGVLNIKLNGTTAGTTYDQLNVGGNVALSGTLNTTVGYSPANGDTYDVLRFSTNAPTSDFTTKNLAALPPPGFLSAAYVSGPPPALRITATTQVADLAVAQTAPASVLHGQNATITVTITNNGPSTATNVTLADTLAGGTLASASITGGTCTGTNCTLLSLGSGSSATATFLVTASSAGTITNSATVSSSTTDTTTANNSTGTASITVNPAADMGVTISGTPALVNAGANETYTVTVGNNGPDTTTSTLNIAITNSTLVSAPGCTVTSPTTATCSVASLATGGTTSFTITAKAPASGTMSITGTVTSPLGDPNTANNNATFTVNVGGCASGAPSQLTPAPGATAVPVTGTLSWNNVSAASYNVYFGPAGSGCATLVASTSATSYSYANLAMATQYEWRIEAVSPGCPTVTTSCNSFTTFTTCPTTPPTLTGPANGSTVSSPVTFAWTAVSGASTYTVFAGVGGATPVTIGSTGDTSLSATIANGTVTWFVVANIGFNCQPLTSANGTFTVCTTAPPPAPAVVSTAASGQVYGVTWDLVGGASRYEIDEATKSDFSDASTKSVTAGPVHYQHTATTAPLTFFYRVRSFSDCDQKFGVNSQPLRAIIVPIPTNAKNPSANVPAGTNQTVSIIVHVPGIAGSTLPFTASVDKPFMTVTPTSGFLPPEGLDFTIVADPAGLDNGTVTATLLLTIVPSAESGKYVATGATVSSTPVSINLVTPVSPTSPSTPPANALIIPSVGHLSGLNSQWQSDVRVTNAGTASAKYNLTFTPGDGSAPKQTTITVAAGETTALDDIIRNWYGIGIVGDAANGVLTIAPQSVSGKEAANDVNIQTVASSRTYNVTQNGTLGQYIPAIPFGSFIGVPAAKQLATVLSLQQVQQNAAYRTNLGLVEAAGKPANVTVSAFDDNGNKLFDFPVSLAAGEQKQLNGFLSSQGVNNLSDGRFEVQVTSGSGKVTAYASLIDNRSGDPLLISGVPAASVAASNYVLPGVADLNNGFASWRSDVRIFNAGTSPQFATLTFYPLNNGGNPSTTSVSVNPGEVKQLNAILNNNFGLSNTGGALHVATGTNSSLVVSGRTYNLAADGSTYGQFIPAVTSADGVGKGGPTLHILQVEDSVRYRTNVGIAEITGKPATAEVTVFVPNSKTSPTATIPLGPNEYRQFDVISSLGLTNVYNARVSVRVVDGDGKVTAYGSVIDMTTQDPTYVPAQQ